ncbi:galactoside 2-alpha-L-fucosyltransferase-like [Gastrolobium bilobum]|uniref:galactoside 2-alpha-L-fucosyltransferase-like n=1 Tax=Gastrolobium bilobum TaxID=150636 RepID=UPI002AB06A36|nr:galactoside 2-alpha-L-fucosyltransferase-like [Gastrolobium bilobum]
MKRLHRNHDDESFSDLDSRSSSVSIRKSSFFSLTRLMSFFLVSLFLFSLSFLLRHDAVPHSSPTTTTTSILQLKQTQQGLNSNASDSIELLNDKLLGGLLTAGFDERSCLSRYHSVAYRKGLSGNPSSYLISRLRKYEALHKECGPSTKSYEKMVKDLRSGHLSESSTCKYVVWISYSGLGNRILTLASAFLYALLTNRVLLVDPGVDMIDLFCEPFPDVSWFLPPDFPLNSKLNNFNQKSAQCYGKMLKNKSITNATVSPFIYLHLAHDYDDQDKLFFCDEDQHFLQKVPWLVVRTDNYFIPSLFLMPSFERELSELFPNKETVFHFLGRYLFRPTNKVWGLVIRYYQAYLANVDERVGIQIRVFDTGTGPFQHVLDQILACILKENLLPDVDRKQDIISSSGKPNSKAVLMTSLSTGYFEKVRDMYWEYPTVTGEVVGIYQPSHEEYQQTEKQMHNQKAWAEMYLLSLTDVLVTSSWSTFGYVAQGLGGLKPWILYKPENETAPDPPCQRAMSMEPCFHAPPFYDCKAKRGTDTGALVPHVRHCEDMSWGLKLVDNYG